MDMTYSLLFFAAALFSSLAYFAWLAAKKRAIDMLPAVAAVATVSAIYLLWQQQIVGHYYILGIEYGIALIATVLVQMYMMRPKPFVAFTVMMLAGFLAYCYGNFGGFAPIGVFGLSTMYGLVYRDNFQRHGSKTVNKDKSKEVHRDIIQIALGIVVLAIIAFLKSSTAIAVVFALIILGYVVNDLSSESRLKGVYKVLESGLERSGVVYGSGALYIAAGTAMVVGFVNSPVFVMFGIVVLFFADSVATIVGVNLDWVKLPYNRNKSVFGSLAFFLITALLGYPLIGIAAVYLGALLAFVESVDLKLDDNVSLAMVVVVAYVLLHFVFVMG
jgi:dolichol kinase